MNNRPFVDAPNYRNFSSGDDRLIIFASTPAILTRLVCRSSALTRHESARCDTFMDDFSYTTNLFEPETAEFYGRVFFLPISNRCSRLFSSHKHSRDHVEWTQAGLNKYN